MEKYKAIPKGYMTIGEVAKKMGVTVRTLQYYDREGLLSPSAESEGGRRLYTDKEVIKLHQILSLKSLGFSLEEIKNRLIALDTPEQVAAALTEQADSIRRKIDSLSEALNATELLKTEVLQMETVDFKKYADIIVNLQMKNEHYWLIKYFDDQVLDHIRGRFDKESGSAMIEAFTRLRDRALRLQKEKIPPESEEGQKFAKEFWNMVMEFTGGDTDLLPNLVELGKFEGMENEWQEKQRLANEYIEPALGVYFERLGLNPFEEKTE